MRTIFVLLFLYIPFILHSQTGDTIHHIQFDTNKIKDSQLLSLSSDTISNDFFIWNDKKNLSEIMDEKSGYFLNYFGIGGRNLIKYNGSDEYSVGIFRDGIQINDNFFGSFDIENISVNEIEKIEEISNVSSFLYGINTRAKSINVITKDRFQPKLFSQFRYSQDRYGAMSADFFVNMPLSRKFNFIFGISNHSNDGRYTNSDFSTWRGRIKLNYYYSPRLNLKTNFYYAKVQRGLNEGLVNSADDTLSSSILASVIDPDAYEKVTNYFFDVTLIAKLFNDNNSLTKLKFYTNNSLREFRDEQNQPIIDSVYLTNNFHSLQYGIDFKQNLKKTFGKDIYADILVGGNAYYNFYNYTKISGDWYMLSANPQDNRFIQNKLYTAIGKIDLNIKNFFLSGFCKTDYVDGNFFFQTGFEGNYDIIKADDIKVTLHSGANSTYTGIVYPNLVLQDYVSLSNIYNTNKLKYIEAGIKVKYDNLSLDVCGYNNNNGVDINWNGNYSLQYASKYFDGYVNVSQFNYQNYPDIFVKSDLAFHNYFFNKKLNLKTGFNIKYFSNFYPPVYSQYQYQTNNTVIQSIAKNLFNVDFYVGARIGTANVNFTVGNIFNRVNYDTFLYPYDNRGGFLNSISRFTIVWDFNQ
jgi:hypothetical protein